MKKSRREILQNSSQKGPRPLPTGLAKIVPNNLFAFPPSMVVIGKVLEQDAEAFSSSYSLSLKHMDVLNVKNAGRLMLLHNNAFLTSMSFRAFIYHAQVFHKIRAQLRFLG